MKKLCVIGSINTDLVANVKRFPLPGETISGTQFNTFFGGKGANQAVAAGKLGATVTMLGKVGDDMYGTQYCENFVSNNVDISAIGQTKGISTGTAVIFVEGSGENSIVIIPGANGEVSAQFIKSKSAVLKSADIFLLQLEIPMASVLFAAQSLKTLKKTVILDPAPAQKLSPALLSCVDFCTPNETELALLTGCKINTIKDIPAAAKKLRAMGVKTVIAKAGKNGAFIINDEGCQHIAGFPVKAVDTTAAGDTFNGSFATALALGKTVAEAVRFANGAAALSTTTLGAQTGMPSTPQLRKFLSAAK